MQAAPVVKSLDVLEQVSPGLVACIIFGCLDEFTLQRREKAFHRRVVPAVALAAHRADHAVAPQAGPVAICFWADSSGRRNSMVGGQLRWLGGDVQIGLYGRSVPHLAARA